MPSSSLPLQNYPEVPAQMAFFHTMTTLCHQQLSPLEIFANVLQPCTNITLACALAVLHNSLLTRREMGTHSLAHLSRMTGLLI